MLIPNVLLASVLLASYSPPTGTKLVESWKADDVKSLRFQKILVVAIAREPTMRKDAEERLREIIGRDRTIASYTVFPDANPPDKEAAKAQVSGLGCDGVVVMRAVGSSSKVSNIPGRIQYEPAYDAFWGYPGAYGYWGTVYTTSWEPGYQEKDTTIDVETLTYDLKRDKLVWSGRTRTKNPGSVRNLVLGVAETVGKQLRKEKLIR